MQKRKCEITPIADINSNLKRPRNAKSSLMGVSSPTNRRPAWGFATLPKTHMNPTRKSVPFYDIRHLLRDQKISFQGIHLRNVQDSHGFWWPGVNSDLEALSCVTGQVGMSFIPLAPTPAPGPPQWTKSPSEVSDFVHIPTESCCDNSAPVGLLAKKSVAKESLMKTTKWCFLPSQRTSIAEWFLTLRFSLKHWKWKSELVAQLHNISLYAIFWYCLHKLRHTLCCLEMMKCTHEESWYQMAKRNTRLLLQFGWYFDILEVNF